MNLLHTIFTIYLLLVSALSFGQEDWTAQQRLDSINLWIGQLEADSTVDTEIIGTGHYSKQYERYDKLVSVASDTQLMDLTGHRSAAVRLYAYYGLTRNNPGLLVEALKAHPDDSANVTCRNGAMTHTSTVYEEALTWAEEFLVRGNPRGLSREDKEYVHRTYLQFLQDRREKSRQEKIQKKKGE